MSRSHHPVRDTTQEARDTARDAIDSARESLEASREQLEEGYERAQDALAEADSWVRERVAEQPLLALGAVAVAGFVLGRTLTRRRR
jgi:ElaB/YqjD/DUF883 family membrane-anchored ribosome-binding protein